MFVWGRRLASFGPGGSTTPPTVTQPPAVTAAADPKPVTPNLTPRRVRSGTLAELAKDVDTLASQAARAASENPNWVYRHLKQVIRLSTLGATTDSAVNMLFAGSLIEAVQLLILEEVTGLSSLMVGDGSDPDRFSAAAPAFAAGTGWIGLRHHTIGARAQETDAILRLTGNAAATGGVVEVTVWFSQFRTPTLNSASPVPVITPPVGSSVVGGLRILGRHRLG